MPVALGPQIQRKKNVISPQTFLQMLVNGLISYKLYNPLHLHPASHILFFSAPVPTTGHLPLQYGQAWLSLCSLQADHVHPILHGGMSYQPQIPIRSCSRRSYLMGLGACDIGVLNAPPWLPLSQVQPMITLLKHNLCSLYFQDRLNIQAMWFHSPSVPSHHDSSFLRPSVQPTV